jgi:hypothetical protein
MRRRIRNKKLIFMFVVLGLATLASAQAKKAAGPCGDKSKRYTDCGNGTVTDSVTGLIWLKDPNCIPMATWDDAKKAVAGLKDGACMLTDGSAAGDWRLPSNKDWEATMAPAKNMMCSYPTLTDDEGKACIKDGKSSFTGLESDYYWSNTPNDAGAGRIFIGDLDHGNILTVDAPNPQRVWPVRGGAPQK